MEGFEVALAALLVAVAGLNALASRVGIPYPIVLVLGGWGLGLMPGLPQVELEPDLVLLNAGRSSGSATPGTSATR